MLTIIQAFLAVIDAHLKYIFSAEQFTEDAVESNFYGFNFTTETLAKLLMFGAYAKEMAYLAQIIQDEVSKYPYLRKDALKVSAHMHLSHSDLISNN